MSKLNSSLYTQELSGKLGVTNLPEIRLELQTALSSGLQKFELILFRMANGKGKLFSIAGFVRKFGETYPDLIAEIRDRLEKEIQFPHEMLFVECFSNGEYRVGKLEQRSRKQYSIANVKAWAGGNGLN